MRTRPSNGKGGSRTASGKSAAKRDVADGRERIANFLAVPLAVEKVTLFGALLCLDGFLYNFTILPIRATFAFTRILSRIVRRQPLTPIPPAHVQSVLRLFLLVIPAVVLLLSTDASKMYHSVRGQDTIKLYVIFNALEVSCWLSEVANTRLAIDFAARSVRMSLTRCSLATHWIHSRTMLNDMARDASASTFVRLFSFSSPWAMSVR